MKAKVAWLPVLLIMCASAHGYPITGFQDIDTYLKRAKDIVIATCVTEPNDPAHAPAFDGLTAADVNVVQVLKGERKPGPLKVVSGEKLEKGKTYLLTNTGGKAAGTDFLATAELSVVPIPRYFDINTLKDKDAKLAVQKVMSVHLYDVERQLAPLLKEQGLLKNALRDRTDDVYDSHGDVQITTTQQTSSHAEGMTRYLEIDSKKMMWSHSSPGQSGFVYFVEQGMPSWEFAFTSNEQITDFEGKPLKAKFYGLYSPGTGENAVTVKVGQVILARTVDDPNTIYIIKFESQEKDSEAVTVRYASVGRTKPK